MISQTCQNRENWANAQQSENFPLTTTANIINKPAYSLQRADGKSSVNDHIYKLGNLSFAKMHIIQVKNFIHIYTYELLLSEGQIHWTESFPFSQFGAAQTAESWWMQKIW